MLRDEVARESCPCAVMAKMAMHPNYFPCKKSANGGKVSNTPNAKSKNATALTFAMATVFVRQRLARMNQVTSHNRIAKELTPESGPVGR